VVLATSRRTRLLDRRCGEGQHAVLPKRVSPPLGVDVRDAQGVQVGGGTNVQINVYSEARSVVWPHQIGSIPLLAECYQHREREAARIDEIASNQIDQDNEAANNRTVVLTQVLSGLGGVGKTQLAADYARRIWAEGAVDLLVWATVSSRAAVQATYAHAAIEIGQLSSPNVEQAAEWFLGWLQSTSRRWLIVLDDVADPADLRGLWPTGPFGQTVITTRRRDAVLTDRGRVLIEVGLYTPAEAVAYLQDNLGRAGGNILMEAVELAADLGYLPLALAQAATFIRDRGETCAGYRRRFGDRCRRLVEILPDDALADDYRFTVATTWAISVDRANELTPAGLARPVLQLLSTLDPNGVPFNIVISQAARTLIARQCTPLAANGTVVVNEQDCLDALRNLHRLNLISMDPAGGDRAIRTHALVQRATLEAMSTDAVAATVRAAAGALIEIWPEIERDTELARILRDCCMALRHCYSELSGEPTGRRALFRAGLSIMRCGPVGAALSYWTELAAEVNAALDVDHRDTLVARRHLVCCRANAGDSTGAVTDAEQLLTDCLRALGADHPDTLKAHVDLARWQGESGDASAAAAALEQLVIDCSRVLGPDHPDTLETRRHLARWQGESGNPAAAAAALERLAADRQRVLGPEHPDTLSTRGNLARWQRVAGDPAGAAVALGQLLADFVRVLGPDHPDTLRVRHNLLLCRGDAGDPVGAAKAFDQLLTDYLRVLGPDHPVTLIARGHLAACRADAGDFAIAADALEQLITDCLRVLGPDHPKTLESRRYLAYCRGDAGAFAAAADAWEELLTDCLRVLGPDHPDTMITRGNFAWWLGHAGHPAGAVAVMEQLLTDRLRVLGPDHPCTLETRRYFARWRGAAGDPAAAAEALEQLLTDCVRVLGPDHLGTLVTRENFAWWLGHAGDPAGAVAVMEQLVTDRLRVLGPDHPDTLETRLNLALWRGAGRHSASAVEALEELLVDYVRVLGPNHPITLVTRNNLAWWRGHAGDPDDAGAVMKQLVTGRLQALGLDQATETRLDLALWR
jgi:tetratricopeptide (TPR) repeat protein